MRLRIAGKEEAADRLVRILLGESGTSEEPIEIEAEARELRSVFKACCCVEQVRKSLCSLDEALCSEYPYGHGTSEPEDEEIPIDDDFPAEGCETATIDSIFAERPQQLLVLRRARD